MTSLSSLFAKLSIIPMRLGGGGGLITNQSRAMSRVKNRHTHPRGVWAKKNRERNEQNLTHDNQSFINQVILDELGPQSVPESTGMPYVSPLREIVKPRGEWTPTSIRCGVIARKIGVYPMWDKQGNRILTTLLQVVDNHAIKYLSPEDCVRNYGTKLRGLGVMVVGAEGQDPQRFTKEYCGLFTSAGLLPKLKLTRFQITPEAALAPGTPLYASHFKVGQDVDIIGKTIDRGFQGVMIRWKFKGLRATHGVTKSHRRGGNTGGGGEKGRVWPGTKMPGHMGNRQIILRAFKIVRINTKYNVIYVKGPNIPGKTGAFVSIKDTKFRKEKPTSAPFPTYYPDETTEALPDDIFDPTMHTFGEPTVLFDEAK